MITFTTIGLGDFAPFFHPKRADWERSVGYFSYALCTLLGLALLSCLLASVAEVMFKLQVQVTGLSSHRKSRQKKRPGRGATKPLKKPRPDALELNGI